MRALLASIGAVVALVALSLAPAAAGASGSQYMYDVEHTGYTEADITPSSASEMTQVFALNPRGDGRFDSIFSQPVYDRGRVYFGAWDGFEYAINPGGTVRWRTYLGRVVAKDQPTGCVPPVAGVSSTATVAAMRLGDARNVLFVGGGGPEPPAVESGPINFYALNADTGAVLWKTEVGLAPQEYVWSSPVYDAGSVYIGIASFGDCPEVQGRVLKLDATTGAILARRDLAPDPCRAAAVWSSPTLDPTRQALYVTTGNGTETGRYDCRADQLTYAWSIVRLDATDLSIVDHWQVPEEQRDETFDSDFGTTPTLFSDAAGTPLVGASNKNGLYYAWHRDDLAAGPVWATRVSIGGACPQCGNAAIAPAAFDGTTLFAPGGILDTDGASCGGNVQALDPADGSRLWLACFQGDGEFPPAVLGAATVTPEVVVVGAGDRVIVLDKADGAIAGTFTATSGDGQPPPSYFWGAPTVTGSRIYAPNMNGTLYGLDASTR